MLKIKNAHIKYIMYFILLLSICSFKFSVAKVSGNSMSPTFENNEFVLVDKLSYIKSKPKYGDLIVFRSTDGQKLVKRIIGVSGDSIFIKNNCVYRNDIIIDEPYLNEPKTDGFIKLIIPDNECFVLGDNRAESVDSRFESVGTIPFHNIIGKVNCTISKSKK